MHKLTCSFCGQIFKSEHIDSLLAAKELMDSLTKHCEHSHILLIDKDGFMKELLAAIDAFTFIQSVNVMSKEEPDPLHPVNQLYEVKLQTVLQALNLSEDPEEMDGNTVDGSELPSPGVVN